MYRYFGLLILDEVDTMAADCFVNVCWKFPAYHRLGFTATPERSDGKWRLIEAHVGPVMCKGTLVPMKAKVLVKKTGWKIPEHKVFVDNHFEFKKIKYAPGRMMPVVIAMAASIERNMLIVEFVLAAYKQGR